MTRSKPAPPRPGSVRRPLRGFGWLDASLLKEHWLQRLQPDAVAVMALLALAADKDGVSYWGRARIGAALAMNIKRVTDALDRLLELGLVAFRPWKQGDKDGVWQLLPLIDSDPESEMTLSDILRKTLHRSHR